MALSIIIVRLFTSFQTNKGCYVLVDMCLNKRLVMVLFVTERFSRENEIATRDPLEQHQGWCLVSSAWWRE